MTHVPIIDFSELTPDMYIAGYKIYEIGNSAAVIAGDICADSYDDDTTVWD